MGKPLQPDEVLGLTGGVQAMAWGNNCDGQLGDGTAFDALMPVQLLMY
ncbi:hypothetical protein HUA76_29870 [Myxococcus sp. CA056]|nr:hypothetical protein [Myxococcus sp. CA056]NTX15008.1 hypothetical protein [Myxococcus sp. CA056]